jgi:UDP-3-O-[3-hydroxymyristoyl] glucosamine N-acyltransferase
VIRFPTNSLSSLVARYGGFVRASSEADWLIDRLIALSEIDVRSTASSELSSTHTWVGLLFAYQATSLMLEEKVRTHLARGGVVVTPERTSWSTQVPSAGAIWAHPEPQWLMALLLAASTEGEISSQTAPSIHPTSEIHPSAILYPNVIIGARVRIGPYCVIGQPGFGFVRSKDGEIIALPHLGGVHLADNVWLGAYVTIDAGVLAPTTIGRGCKIDSHVHIGHNCILGENVTLCGQVGLAGSVTVDDHAMIGGQAGIADHVHIGSGARIAAKSGVIGNVPAGQIFAGYPARERSGWLRSIAALSALAKRRSR